MNNQGYLLTAGPELERLRLQAKMWEPEAERCLDMIGIREGWHCIDLGCGAQGVLEPLSRRVGAEGKVIGVDRDPLQLESAHALVRGKALANVVIKDADAYATGFAPGLFDLAHVRFLFAPVGRDAELIRHMLDLVRPGGVPAGWGRLQRGASVTRDVAAGGAERHPNAQRRPDPSGVPSLRGVAHAVRGLPPAKDTGRRYPVGKNPGRSRRRL